MATRKYRLCHHPELIQRLLDAADMIYLDPQGNRARLNRLLGLVERLQGRNPLITPPRHYHFGSASRSRSAPFNPPMNAECSNGAEPSSPEQLEEAVGRRRRAALSSSLKRSAISNPFTREGPIAPKLPTRAEPSSARPVPLLRTASRRFLIVSMMKIRERRETPWK